MSEVPLVYDLEYRDGCSKARFACNQRCPVSYFTLKHHQKVRQEQVPKSMESTWEKFLTSYNWVESPKTVRETASKGEIIGEHNRNNTILARDRSWLPSMHHFVERAYGLQTLVNKAPVNCDSWNMNLNVKKTKCITFQKKHGSNKKDTFMFGNRDIESVNYLGMIINANGSLHNTVENLSCKAQRAVYALNNRFPIKRLPI